MMRLDSDGPGIGQASDATHGRWHTTVPALAGGLLALAYPPFPLGFIAYVAVAVVLLAVRNCSVRVAAQRGFVFGFVFHLSTLYWIGWVSIWGMLVIVLVLGLYVALVFAAYAFLSRLIGDKVVWLFPVLWTAHEYLRGLGNLAFPWTNLSLTQVGYLNLIQFADITGDLGVGFWVLLINALVYQLIVNWTAPLRRATGKYAVVIVLLFVLPFLYGWGTIESLETEEAIRVAVLQGDIDSFHKWDSAYVDQSFAVYETQVRASAERGAELIVLPETAAPVYLRSKNHYRQRLRNLAAATGVPMLVGTLEYKTLPQGNYLSYNAAVALDPAGYQPDFHAKLHLVPLGEWIPFSNRIKILDRLEVGGAHFTAGDHLVLFSHRKGPYAAAICFESVFPDIVRRFAEAGVRFFVNITNDGWYGFSSPSTGR
jgi:apolipoprotein N-acyltransferase